MKNTKFLEALDRCPTCKAYVDKKSNIVYTSKCLEMLDKITNDPLLSDREREAQIATIQENYLMFSDEFKSKVCDLRYDKLNRKCLL